MQEKQGGKTAVSWIHGFLIRLETTATFIVLDVLCAQKKAWVWQFRS
jgi:hypothetical protein